MPLVRDPYMVIFNALDMLVMASPYVRLNWSYFAEASMPNALRITDWSKGWMVQTTYCTVTISGSPGSSPSSASGTTVFVVSFTS